MNITEPWAVDPVVLFLRGTALEIYWLIHHHPHEPSTGELQKALGKARPEELQGTLARAKALGAYFLTLFPEKVEILDFKSFSELASQTIVPSLGKARRPECLTK